MILKSLHLEYFKQYSKLELEFQEGLVGIVGKNGAGKSSIFEAVLLCLFGKTITDKEFYKTSWAPDKSATVLELQFELNQKTYKVRREFRGKAMAHHAYLYDPKEELIANGVNPVSESIAQLIGLDRDAFMRSVFSGQKELGIISNTRGEERKRMVRRMVGLDKLDKIQQLVRDDRNIKKREIQGQENLLFSSEQKEVINQAFKELAKTISTTQKELKKSEDIFNKTNTKYLSAKKTFDEQNNVYKQFNTLQQQLGKWEENLTNLNQREVELKNEISSLEKSKKELKDLSTVVKQYQGLKTEIVELEKTQQQFEQKKQIQLQRTSLKTQIDKFQQDIQRLPELTQQGQEANKQLEVTQTTLQEHHTQLSQLEEKATQTQAAIGSIQGRIKERQEQLQGIQQLGADAECPTCLQPLVDTYQNTLDRLQDEIQRYEQQELATLQQQQTNDTTHLQQLKEKIQQIQKEQSVLESRHQVLREQFKQCKKAKQEADGLLEKDQALLQQEKALGTIHFDPAVLSKAKSDLAALEPSFLAFTKLEQAVERLPVLSSQKEELEERIKKGKQGIKEQQASIKALNFSIPNFEKIKVKMDTLESEKDAQQLAVRQQTQTLNELLQQQTALQRDLDNQERIQKEIGTNQAALEELELLDKLFTSFKNQMLIRIRPTIKDTAGRLFEQITRGRYEGIEVDNNFEFHIFENGQSYPIQRFSGGEIDLANLCLRIGISKAIAELSGSEVAMNFLAFDEIFGSQDEERRFEILLALDHLKEQYRQIYIISHIDTIKEHFPSILEVFKTEDGSQVAWR